MLASPRPARCPASAPSPPLSPAAARSEFRGEPARSPPLADLPGADLPIRELPLVAQAPSVLPRAPPSPARPASRWRICARICWREALKSRYLVPCRFAQEYSVATSSACSLLSGLRALISSGSCFIASSPSPEPRSATGALIPGRIPRLTDGWPRTLPRCSAGKLHGNSTSLLLSSSGHPSVLRPGKESTFADPST